MLRFILRRLAAGVVLLFVISSLAFMLLYVGSGDIARSILGQTATQETVAAEEAGARARPADPRPSSSTGCATPSPVTSARRGSPASRSPRRSRSRLAVTLVARASARSSSPRSSRVAARRAGRRARGGWVDRMVQVVLGARLRHPRLPDRPRPGAASSRSTSAGSSRPATSSSRLADAAGCQSVTLPIIALASAASPASRAGPRLGDRRAAPGLRAHAAQPRPLGAAGWSTSTCCATPPARRCRSSAVQFIGLLGGAVIVEHVFAIPGLGQVAVARPRQGDIPLVMGLVIVDRRPRRHRQPRHRPAAGLAQPEGAGLMSDVDCHRRPPSPSVEHARGDRATRSLFRPAAAEPDRRSSR